MTHEEDGLRRVHFPVRIATDVFADAIAEHVELQALGESDMKIPSWRIDCD